MMPKEVRVSLYSYALSVRTLMQLAPFLSYKEIVDRVAVANALAHHLGRAVYRHSEAMAIPETLLLLVHEYDVTKEPSLLKQIAYHSSLLWFSDDDALSFEPHFSGAWMEKEERAYA